METETMRTFNNIATLIKTKRIEHAESYSQSELANLLGYKGDKLIASIEKAEREVPLKFMSKLSEVLNIDQDDFIEAVMKDHIVYLDNFFEKPFNEKTM